MSTFQASSLAYSSLPFPSPKSTVFSIMHSNILFVTLPISSINSSQSRTSSNTRESKIKFVAQINDSTTTEESHLDIDKRNSRLLVQDLVQKIEPIPTTQRTKIVGFLEADGGFHQTISDFNDLLMALVTADELDLALKLYSKISNYGLVPNSWTFCVLISCYCKKNEPSEAQKVAHHMFENGIQPTAATFTVVISAFCRRGRIKEALEVLRIMGRIDCEPTIRTYNCLLKGLCYVGKVEKAYELLKNIKKSSIKPDICTYTVVMDGFCKVGRTDEALELLDEAVGMGLIPNVITFNAIFTGYFKEGRPLKGIGLLKKMKDINCMPDYISYSTLLHGLLKWGEIHSALGIYNEMVGIGFKVDERMMNTLLRGLCRRSRKQKEMLKYAYQMFDKMRDERSVIYSSTYDLVIEGLCTGKDADKAMVNLIKMVGVGYVPKKITFDKVVRALCVEGKLEEALLVLVLMYRGSGIPSKISFNILINEFNRQGRRLGACNVYGAAVKVGVIPEREPRGCSTKRYVLI